jgi:hypothetical protein
MEGREKADGEFMVGWCLADLPILNLLTTCLWLSPASTAWFRNEETGEHLVNLGSMRREETGGGRRAGVDEAMCCCPHLQKAGGIS